MSLRTAITEKDHKQGKTGAAIELVEYGDYQCPYCGKAYFEVKKLQDKLGDKLLFVFRNFPLSNMHEHAFNAAIASEVAGSVGKFWQMHDLLFENQRALDDYYLIEYAKKLGIDRETFEAKFSEPEFEEKVENDLESGLRSGVNGTPSFFINGEKYEGSYLSDDIYEYIRNIL